MKKFLLIILILCAVAAIRCKRKETLVTPNEPSIKVTKVSGEQSGTWSGRIEIIDDVVVPNGQTLTIKAGTSVISDGYFEIGVYGTLNANGRENARISFTVADTTGYSNFDDASAGAWKGFSFAKSESVNMSYCDFSYGKTELNSDGGMMRVNFVRDFELSHCRFHHNTTRRKGGAIYAENSTMNIHDCEVYDNFAIGFEGTYNWGVGFQFLKCNLVMHDMVFHDNYSEYAYGGGMNIDSCNLELTNSVFYNNFAVDAGGLGLQRSKGYNVKVSNMLAYNNAVIHYGGALATATTDAELNNLTLVNNICGGGGGAAMQMAFNASPTLNNCIIWGNHALHITNKDTRDTTYYYMGSQIWLWGDDCSPIFNNGVVQYGLDSINGYHHILEGNYNDMLEINPLFVNEEAHNYQLLENSPCINSGLADITGLFLPDIDLAGRPRVYGGRIDMGCYEWQGK